MRNTKLNINIHKKTFNILVFFLIIVGSIIIVCGQTIAIAQSKKTAIVSLIHTQPKPHAIPYPGQNLTIQVKLSGTKETNKKITLVGAIDGRSIIILPQPGYLDEYDQPTYNFIVTAPLGTLSYMFLLYSPDGKTQSSKNFYVRRQCIPDIEMGESQIPEKLQGYDRLERLVRESNKLKNDLAGYEKILLLLDEIQKRISK